MRLLRRRAQARLAKRCLLFTLVLTSFLVAFVSRQLGLSESVLNALQEDIAIEPCSHYLKEVAIHKEWQSAECVRILKTKSKYSFFVKPQYYTKFL